MKSEIKIDKKVKDFEVGTVLECVLFTKAKGGRSFMFQGQVLEKGLQKHLIGFRMPTKCCLLSFGPGTRIKRILRIEKNVQGKILDIFRFKN